MNELFQEVRRPRIYVYTEPQYKHSAWNGPRQGQGLLKIGYTTKSVLERVKQQFPTLKPNETPFEILLDQFATRNDESLFTDKDVHRALKQKGIVQLNNSEWFECTLDEVENTLLEIKTGCFHSQATQSFTMRPEQEYAVKLTAEYFTKYASTKGNYRPPHFLWNAKMRFGKTFTAYQLAKKMNWKKILVLTFKPAVQSAWEEDLTSHVDFSNWQFISKNNASCQKKDKEIPFVWFASFQDILGKTPCGGIKIKNQDIHAMHWDCIIFDEYHFGAWRENAKELFDAEKEEDKSEKIQDFEEDVIPLTTNSFLYLSGTPFRALASGEFTEDQIFNWTYSDEQREKLNWNRETENPYEDLPKMVMMTYQLPEEIRHVALTTDTNQFDLNEFFKADEINKKVKFKYENEILKWLKLLQGQYLPSSLDALKERSTPPMPFSDRFLLDNLHHTFWFLPTVNACKAMGVLLKNERFFRNYKIIVCAGTEAGIGLDALTPVKTAIGNPFETKTVTLSCGKLATGVTVKPWSGIFMLRNTSSPETYFQAAFRVQSPWVLKNSDKKSPNTKEILKKVCYIFDYAPDRALSLIEEYSGRLDFNSSEKPEKRVEEFIKFLPVLCYDGSRMIQINASELLDIVTTGTASSMLAKRWESALLVNVDNETLSRVLASPEALKALNNIEGFRSLNINLNAIITKSNALKKLKKEHNGELPEKEKEKISDEEKEIKSKRDKIKEKLIKFATRIPIFMYLTEYREETLKDVITQLEPDLFKKVTGLSLKDFEILISLNLFNSTVMNSAILAFKRYEDTSLEYTGISIKQSTHIGAFDTKISREEYKNLPIPMTI